MYIENINYILQIAVGYWITNRYTGMMHKDYFHYNHLIGEEYVRKQTNFAQSTNLGNYTGSKDDGPPFTLKILSLILFLL